MSGLSPARRLASKTSDITDFFRGHSSSQTQNDTSTAGHSTLEVPYSDSEGVVGKKKITRIPLFGRSRKKSNQSAASSPFASTLSGRESADLGGQSSRAPSTSTDRRPPEPSPVAEQPPPLPTSSKVPSSSLTSKFAAHFSHSRSSKVPVTAQIISAPIPSSSRQASGLSPHSPRSGSDDSGSSGGSKARSTTPRPTQPTITVSLSPDNADDLFTRPTSTPAKRASDVPKPLTSDRNAGHSSSSSPTPTSEPSIYRRGHTPASAIAAAVRHQRNPSISSERPPSTSSKDSNSNSNSRKNSDSDKSHDKHDGASTPRLSDAREFPRPAVPEKDRVLPPSLQRRASVATGSIQSSDHGSSSTRSRMKQPAPPARTRPPSMPLPLPPLPSTPPPEVPPSPRVPFTTSIKADSQSASQKGHAPRPRAHTLGGSVASPSAALPPLSRPTTSGSPEAPPVVEQETLDIDTASMGQLRQALKTRNKQYDELATYVLKATEAHVAEVLALEKKIHGLSKDIARRDTEIKGLKYMINDEEPPKRTKTLPLGVNSSRLSPIIKTTVVDSDQEVHSSPPSGPSRRLYYQSDSGTESHAHSGAESIRGSGASGSESVSSILRGKKIRRPFHLGEFGANLARVGSTRRSSKLGPGVGDSSKEAPYSKRTSLSSTSPSPSSSTSSLLPPSPSITMSSLSAIPEGHPSSLLRYESSDQQEERRALRASYRTSTSSITSSSTAASSSAYSIKRSRPTSIAQVLEKSPNMDDVLEKLRPFA